jgi:hypothetical protein
MVGVGRRYELLEYGLERAVEAYRCPEALMAACFAVPKVI